MSRGFARGTGAGGGWEIARGVGDRGDGAFDHDDRGDRSSGGSIVCILFGRMVYILVYFVP